MERGVEERQKRSTWKLFIYLEWNLYSTLLAADAEDSVAEQEEKRAAVRIVCHTAMCIARAPNIDRVAVD